MINAKNVLGKLQDKIGVKDAVHTAIVSVRAANAIEPGDRCGLNEFNEAVRDSKGVGVADPWLKKTIKTGEIFWLVLGQSEIPNVQHVWEHPKVKFDPPTRDVQLNKYILKQANDIGVSYKELMDAADLMVNENTPTKYIGKLSELEFKNIFDEYEFWSEWSDETGYEFENYGSECCPEYKYPDSPFYFK